MPAHITLRKSIEFAATTEDMGAKYYSDLASKFSHNQEMSQLFFSLAKEEVAHKKQFVQMLKSIPEDEDSSKNGDDILYLKAMATSKYFSVEKGPFKDIDNITTREEALGKAFEFEKATLGFYQAIKEILGEHDVLNAVIAAEKKHVVNIMKIMVADGKLRGLEDPW